MLVLLLPGQRNRALISFPVASPIQVFSKSHADLQKMCQAEPMALKP